MAVSTSTALLAAGAASAGAAAYGANQSKKQGKAALGAQEDQNAKNEAFLREQYAKGRKDALKYIPQGADAAQKAYERAYEVARQAGRTRSGIYTKGNMAAQNTLLAGLPQMNNALLGEPVDLSGLQANAAGSGGPQLYNNLQLQPGDIPNALAGVAGDMQEIEDRGYSVDPGKTPNRDLVNQAYNAGDISGRDYKWFQNYFDQSGSGDSTYWSTFNPGDFLSGENLDGFNHTNRKRIETVVNAARKYNGAN